MSFQFDEEQHRDAQNAVLCWLATCGSDGQPSVSPKEIWALAGTDRILIAEIASPGSLINLRTNAKACISFIDIFRQRGWKCHGEVGVIAANDPRFPAVAAPVLELAGTDYPVRHVIVMQVAQAARIMAPSYRLFPERIETERIKEAYRTYGVRPR